MITENKKWHYLAIKKLSASLRGMTSTNNGDYCHLNCLHSFRKKNKPKEHENICQDDDYCCVEMPNENNKVLKYNPGEKSRRVPFIIYLDLESLLEKISTCQNNPKKSSTTKTNKHKISGYSLFTHCSFDNTKNRHEIEGKIMTEVVSLRAKTYPYLMDYDSETKKARGTKKCVIKGILRFQDYKICLFNNKVIIKYNKDLKVKHIMYVLKKSTRLY